MVNHINYALFSTMKRDSITIKRIGITFFFSLFSFLLFTCDLAPKSEPALSPLASRPNSGTWYQIMPGSFYDSNNDGIGDLKGITIKLDYLNDSHTYKHKKNIEEKGECLESLHVNGIWLTPIHPSPSYHKYDVKDYKAIDPQFGTMEDFRELLYECHKRGIKLIIDMVMNHTADQHPWFQKALEEIRSGTPGRYASYYHFYYGAIPPQRESVDYADWYWAWDGYYDSGSQQWIPDRGIRGRFYRCWGKAMEGVWYEGSFWTGMPDLNWNSHLLREEFEDIVNFWLGEGLDGYRLDAVHYFYLWDELGQYDYGVIPHDTHVKNVQMLKWFTNACRKINPNVFLVGECWRDVPIIETYFNSGMNFFHFGAAGEMKNTMNSGKGRDWVNFLTYWERKIKARNPNAVITTFISNHDKSRSFYDIGDDWYTDQPFQNPNPSDRGDDRRRFAASLNLLAPGTPFIYYGEEIGLFDNNDDYWSNDPNNDYKEFIHENTGRRAYDDTDFRGPMWWSNSNRVGTTNAPENRRWSDAALKSQYGNGVEEQLDPNHPENVRGEYSLLKHYIRLGSLKSRYPFIAWGSMGIVDTKNENIGAYRITDTWSGSPTYGKSVVVAHNADYDYDREFILETAGQWIDGVCAKDFTWTPTMSDDGKRISLPPFYSAIIGEYEWE